MSLLWEMFTYPFILRAFVVGILVALCAALLGVPLVLKRYSMIGDGLSHVSFGALSIALACGWAPLPVSIPVVILAALGLLRMTEKSRMGADAAIAVVSASALAIGVVVTSLTTGMTTDVDSFMFGSILAMDRADVALSVVLCAALLGVPLVLKRYSMIGDGLSHVSFGALSVAVACGWAPLPVSIPVVVIAALGLLRMTERSRLGADAAIAVVSASALAIGIIVTSLTTGMTTDVDSYMFGSILALSRADVALSIGVSAAVLVLFGLFYHQLFAITFDESFSRATGMKVGVYNTLLAVLTALTIVLGMRMMGAMLISSLVIFPALTAMGLLRSFRGVVLCAAGLSVVCFCIGLTGSYLWGTPVGATVVLVNLAAFLLSRGVMRIKRAA